MIARRQISRASLSADLARMEVRAGRWQRVHPRVYATFSGPLPRVSQIWAALLYAGDGATLSHETAAELWGILDASPRRIQVTIPVHRRVASLASVQIHYATRLDESRHPTRFPPITRPEDTILDLIDRAGRPEQVVSLLTVACQRRRTTPERLGIALDARKKIRWRKTINEILSEVSAGAESPLEVAYVRKVERAHGLPEGRRQRRHQVGGRSNRTDVEYDAYKLIVELDGRLGHETDGKFRDYQRDNLATTRGRDTLRYGWTDTTTNSCRVAAQVAQVLRANGWTSWAGPCGPTCAVGEVVA